jgi:hypothetical protein
MNAFLLAVTLLAAGPFIGKEERIGTTRSPLDLTLVRSADATLLAWSEDSQVRARVNGKTITLGPGIDVRAATDGRDFQIVWFDQNRIAGARWSNPSHVTTLVNLNVFNPPPRKPPAVVWNGSAFEISVAVDAMSAMPGLIFTASSSSMPAQQICVPPFFGGGCRQVPARYGISVGVRAGSEFRTFSTAQEGYTSNYPSSIAAANAEGLVVWKSPTGIEGFRVRRDGSAAGFINVPISRSMTGKRGPQVAWDGTRYLIVFDRLDANGDIWGAVVMPGATYVAEPFVIAGSADNELAPAVTALGPDRFLVAYAIGNEWIGTREVSFQEPLPSRRRATR